MKESELHHNEFTGVQNTPFKLWTHPHPRLFLAHFEKRPLVSCWKLLFVNNCFVYYISILLLRRDEARLLGVSKEGRARPAVCRPRLDILVRDGCCMCIFHFRRQASKNFIHEHDRCTTLLNDATGSASVLMLQLPSERLTM